MSLCINDIAPDFTTNSTQGEISFHDWIGNGWAVLFSHPKDFTPVCTTELGALAKLESEFSKRNVKVIGLSVDSVNDHNAWLDDIEEVTKTRPTYPIIADSELKIAKLYGMLQTTVEGNSEGRTAVDNQTVRTVFVIGPDKKIKLFFKSPIFLHIFVLTSIWDFKNSGFTCCLSFLLHSFIKLFGRSIINSPLYLFTIKYSSSRPIEKNLLFISNYSLSYSCLIYRILFLQ